MRSSFFAVMLSLNILAACGQIKTNFNINGEEIDPISKRPVGWSYSFNKDQEKAYEIKLDSNVKKDGKYSFSIKKIDNQSDFAALDYIIPKTFQGNSIELKGYIKTEDVNSGFAGMWLRIDGASGSIAFDNMQSKNLKGTNDWKQYSIILPYDSEEARTIHVGGLLSGDGRAWFDNFELFLDGKVINEAQEKKNVLTKADTDTAFNKTSGINDLKLTPRLIKNLEVTGQFWGFLKYHHPAIAKGEYNWDAELFRILPGSIQATSDQELSKTLETYLNQLPTPARCSSCEDVVNKQAVLKPDYGLLLNSTVLSKSLTEKLIYIKNNRNVLKNYYAGYYPETGNVKFEHEKPYAEMAYPDAGYRLLCLYRYWAMINYFFPYKDVIGTDWNKTLSTFIPVFINAKDKKDYTIAALKLIGSINDTHANIWGSNRTLDEIKGKNTVPFGATFVQGKLVVTEYYADTMAVKNKLKLGDIIVSINGKAIDQLVEEFLPLTPASNYDTKLRDLPFNYLLRSNLSSFNIGILREGKTIHENINTIDLATFYKAKYSNKAKSSYNLINKDIGYVFPGKYKNAELPEIKKLFKDTKGIIIDMRCYPSEFMPFTFGNYIKSFPGDFVKITRPSQTQPGLFVYTTPIVNGALSSDSYKGKVIVIVNSTSQSQAEYTTMAFQSSPNVKVIGSMTAGADGNVSSLVLPGGISSMISGLGIFYPDNTKTQRVGVKIDEEVRPTIKGIIEEKDELLQRAIQMIL